VVFVGGVFRHGFHVGFAARYPFGEPLDCLRVLLQNFIFQSVLLA
jgi:hypothetical protein